MISLLVELKGSRYLFWSRFTCCPGNITLYDIIWGGADGRVVKVLDSQPRDRGFESRHTLGLLCESPWARFVP